MRIVGASFNDPDSLSSWVESESYQYEIWQDTNKTLAVHYGAAADTFAFFPDRISVLLDENGDLLLEYLQPNVNSHPGQVLADCEILFGD